MSIPLKELVKKLAAKPGQDEEVEFIVCTVDGGIVAMDVQAQAKPMAKALKMFGPNSGRVKA